MLAQDPRKLVPTPNRLSLAVALAFGASVSLTAQGQALPSGGQIAAGAGSIGQTSATSLLVKQTTDRLAVNWQSFSIGAGNSVRFDQPSVSSIALNRVLGNSRSEIFGNLSSNGQVFLVNANGILFGRGAQMDVGGLVASTLNISDKNFLEGKFVFSDPSNAASVVNEGSITARNGGVVALIGNQAINRGTIEAHLGSVVLGAGGTAELTLADNKLIKFEVTQGALNALADNGGLIRANGGQVILTAGAKESLLASTVNNTGVIEAQTVERQPGNILLLAGMEAGTTNVGGTLDASAPSGANGGFIETSGAHVHVARGTKVTTAAPSGNAGTWLIDPTDFTIAATGGDMTGGDVESALAGGNFSIASSGGATSGNGDINVNDNVSWSANTLTLNADRDININAVMSASGAAALEMNTAQAVAGGTVRVGFNPNGTFKGRVDFTSSGALTINGNAYTIVSDLASLQGMQADPAGYYALGGDIDASATSGWNSGQGFDPIGNFGARFNGQFDGLGHTVSGVYIHRTPFPTDGVSFFGVIGGSGQVRNVGLTGMDVSGTQRVGGIAGSSYGAIYNSYTTGVISGSNYLVGGLVGQSYGTINASHSDAAVSGLSQAGGLVGGARGPIDNSYATGNVTGTSQLGGLVGRSYGVAISNSYAKGNVSGNDSLGGLVGYGQGPISNSHATGNVTGGGDSVGGLAGSNYGAITGSFATGNVQGASNVGGLVGRFSGSNTLDTSYAIGNVSATGNNVGGLVGRNYGTISNSYYTTGAVSSSGSYGIGPLVGTTNGSMVNTRYDADVVTVNGGLVFADGALYHSQFQSFVSGGMSLDITNFSASLPLNAGYYDISSVQGLKDLLGFADNASYKFRLTGNVDLSSSANFYIPKFSANEFNGSGFAVNNLNVNLPNTDRVGLFGFLASGSTVTNLTVSGSVTGRNQVGGLVGYNQGTINNSVSSVNVIGERYIGGVTGWNDGTISASRASGSVTGVAGSYGSYGVGGLVGLNFGGISGSRASGSVSGDSSVGGLVGVAGGTISDSYFSSGTVNGVSEFGGLIGRNYGGTITNSHYEIDTVTINGGLQVGRGGLYGSQFQDWLANSLTLNIANYSASLPSLGGGIYGIGNVQGMKDLLGFSEDPSLKFQLTASFGLIPGLYIPVFSASEFDGAGRTIGNLNVNLPSARNVGLFGEVAGNSTIKNVVVSGAHVVGDSNVGGLAGRNSGLISNSQVTGSVISGNYEVGGLVGGQDGGSPTPTGFITGSRSTGNVISGHYSVGGLVGSSYGATISSSFATGNTISGSGQVGGLVGSSYGNTFANSYAAASTITATSNGGPFLGQSSNDTFSNSRYSIDTATVNGAQVFAVGGLFQSQFQDWLANSMTLNIANYSGSLSSLGGGVYGIGSLQGMKDLLGFADTGGANFRLTTDVDLASLPGFYVPKLNTAFDGNGHVLSNLNINLPATSNVGLFGVVAAAGSVTNLGVSGNVIGGDHNVGGLAGINQGAVSGSFSTANVSGGSTRGYGVGGLIGRNYGTVSNSYATGNVTTGTVSGGRYAGGLVGRNEGAISGSYAKGNVVGGDYYTGGLVGYSTSAGTISTSYATGNVSARGNWVGGLVGIAYGNVTSSYATGNASGSYGIGGLVGYLASGVSVIDSYAVGNVTGSSSGGQIGGLVGLNQGGLISNAFASGSVTGGSFNTGGLVGSNNGTISNSNASGNVSGASNVGGLVGGNSGTIENGSATGAVSGTSYGVGGLVGANYGAITNSYATGNASSTVNFVGGLVGRNFGSGISNVYASGAATGPGSSVGGLVGFNNYGTVTNGYYNSTVNANPVGTGHTGGIIGLSATQMQDPANFTSFTFTATPAATGNSWVIIDGQGDVNGGAGNGTTPMLASEYSTTLLNAHQLQLMAMDLSASYTLAGNIDASRTASGGSDVWGSAGFVPIGNGVNRFGGSLDGGFGLGRTISNLTIDRPAQFGVGLFGFTTSAATISNVGMVGGSISGSNYTGGLVGASYGSISNSYATSSVSGQSWVGGLVGGNYGPISNSYATGNVSGTGSRVGGLAGSNYGSGTISNSYATGSVIAGNYSSEVGGLVGLNNGTISSSYATGNVTAGDYGSYFGGLVGFNSGAISSSYATGSVSTGIYSSSVGGLVGYNSYGTISNSYATGSVTTGNNSNNIGGLVGANNYGTIDNSYATGSVSGSQLIGGLVGYNYNGTISNSYATGSVSGNNSVGGLVGRNYGGAISDSYATGSVSAGSSSADVGGLVGTNSYGSITSGYATGSVSGHNNVGGLVGSNAGGSISNSYATGSVTGSGYQAGGLTGYNNSGTIGNSYATGSVNGNINVGGLVGTNQIGPISDSYATGSVTGSSYVGGLVGYNDSAAISTSYSNGSVSGNSFVGGLVGFNYGSGTVVNSYWDMQTSGQATSAGGMGLTTMQMRQQASFIGFDFTSGTPIWGINEGFTAPYLTLFGNTFVPPAPPSPTPPSPTSNPVSDQNNDPGFQAAIISAQQGGGGGEGQGSTSLSTNQGSEGGGGGGGGVGGQNLIQIQGAGMNLPDGVE